MMTLYYTGQSVLLTDDVCEALLRYAQALADSQGSDVVTVPVLAPDGQSIAGRIPARARESAVCDIRGRR